MTLLSECAVYDVWPSQAGSVGIYAGWASASSGRIGGQPENAASQFVAVINFAAFRAAVYCRIALLQDCVAASGLGTTHWPAGITEHNVSDDDQPYA